MYYSYFMTQSNNYEYLVCGFPSSCKIAKKLYLQTVVLLRYNNDPHCKSVISKFNFSRACSQLNWCSNSSAQLANTSNYIAEHTS